MNNWSDNIINIQRPLQTLEESLERDEKDNETLVMKMRR